MLIFYWPRVREAISVREASGMNKPILVATAAILRLVIAVTLLVLAGRAFNASAQTLTNLYWFSGADGSLPYAGLVQGSDGNFYGTAHDGGAMCYGTVFRFSLSDSLTNLHSFNLPSTGQYPEAALVQGSDGNFYGTAR